MHKQAEPAHISVDQVSNLERSLSITIPISQIEEKEAEEFKKLAQNAQIKGYRKGKVPPAVLRKLYAESVHGEVVRKLTDATLTEALKTHALQPVGQIQIDSMEAELGQPIKIKASFEVSPKIKLMDMSQLVLEKFKVNLLEADVQKKLEALRVRHATWLPTSEPAKKGDQVKIDYEGQLDGKAFPGGSNQGVTLRLGDDTMIPGFEEKLIGAKAGDTVSFDVKFPKDYAAQDLKGKKAHFTVKVHEVSLIQLPDLDDNFAKKLDVEEGLEALKQKLKDFMEDEVQQVAHENLKYQMIEQLTKKHPIDLPKSLVESEIKTMQARAQQQFANVMKEGTFPELPRASLEKQAGKRVTIGLLFLELAKKYDLKPNQEAFQRKVQTMASAYHVPTDTLMKWLGSNESARQQILSSLLEDQVVDKVLEQAQTKEKVVSYQDAIEWTPEEG